VHRRRGQNVAPAPAHFAVTQSERLRFRQGEVGEFAVGAAQIQVPAAPARAHRPRRHANAAQSGALALEFGGCFAVNDKQVARRAPHHDGKVGPVAKQGRYIVFGQAHVLHGLPGIPGLLCKGHGKHIEAKPVQGQGFNSRRGEFG